MTILEAIEKTNKLKFNTYDNNDKIEWLSRCDGMIKKDIIDKYVGSENISFEAYNETTELGTVLLVPAPYDELYIRYLEAQIDYANGEYARYNNSITMFNSVLQAYAAFYITQHTPKSSKKRFKF